MGSSFRLLGDHLTFMTKAEGPPMNRSIKYLFNVYKCVHFPEHHLFNRIIDIALDESVEDVMTNIPPEYLTRFHDWIDRLLPSLDTLIKLKSGPLSDQEKATIRAIDEWFDRHPADDRPHVEATGASANGRNASGPLQPVSDSGSPTV